MCDCGNKTQGMASADLGGQAQAQHTAGVAKAQTAQDSLRASAYEDHKAEQLKRLQAEIRTVALDKALSSYAMHYTENLSAEAIVARADTFAKFLENGAS